MALYTIHSKKEENLEDCILIQESFNWYSFFLGIIWSLYNKVWSLSLLHLALFILKILAIQFNLLDKIIIEAISFFLSIAIAFHANDFYRNSLERKCYKMLDVVLSKNKEDALVKFLEKNYKNA